MSIAFDTLTPSSSLSSSSTSSSNCQASQFAWPLQGRLEVSMEEKAAACILQKEEEQQATPILASGERRGARAPFSLTRRLSAGGILERGLARVNPMKSTLNLHSARERRMFFPSQLMCSTCARACLPIPPFLLSPVDFPSTKVFARAGREEKCHLSPTKSAGNELTPTAALPTLWCSHCCVINLPKNCYLLPL